MRTVHPGAGRERGHEADLERNKWKIFIPCGQRCSKTAVLQLCPQGSKTLTVTFWKCNDSLSTHKRQTLRQFMKSNLCLVKISLESTARQ